MYTAGQMQAIFMAIMHCVRIAVSNGFLCKTEGHDQKFQMICQIPLCFILC